MIKNLLCKVKIIMFVVLISFETINISPKPALAEQNILSSQENPIISIAVKPNTPTKLVNSIAYWSQGQTLEFNLLDIDGNPVTYGNYTGYVTITGPALFENFIQASQTAELKIKNGTGKITFYVTNYCQPGEITITPHFRTLLNKTFTEKLYIPGIKGNASKIVLKDQPQETTFRAETIFANLEKAFLIYNLQAEDENDNPTATNVPSDLIAEVTYNGELSTAVDAKTIVTENGSYSVALKLKSKELQNVSDIPTGNYTVTIKPKSTAKTTFDPLTETFMVK